MVVNSYAQPLDEDAVKTAFLYNLISFIDWPATASQQSSFNLCVAGDQALHGNLAVLEDKKINNLPIVVSYGVHGNKLKNCQVVFVTEYSDADAIVRDLKKLPIVMASDTNGFVEKGGTLGLIKDGNRVSFEINMDTAKAGGLHVNARLLKLAKNVIFTR